jgi:Putative Ig domain
VAVDNHGNALTDSGGSWSSPSSIDSTNALESVSCPTVNFCAAVDAVGNALTFPPPISIITTSLPHATFGHRYSATLEASGGNPPYIWSARLPRGLHLNKTTGLISGVAKHPGNFVVKVTLRDQKIRISNRPATQNRVAARFLLTTT